MKKLIIVLFLAPLFLGCEQNISSSSTGGDASPAPVVPPVVVVESEPVEQ